MPHLPKTRIHRWSFVLALVLPLALLGPAVAFAGVPPGTVPTITSPADGSTITNKLMTVTATSTATDVTFIVDNRMGDFTQVVPVSGGVASAEFSLLGLRGSTPVTAYDCADATTCNVDFDSITVNIDLTNPKITSPNPGDVVRNAIPVDATAPGGTLKFYLNGQLQGQDSVAPYRFVISLEGKKDAEYIASARQCNQAGDVCQGEVDKVTVIKDTKGPRWTDLNTSQRTVFPVKDNYKDSTRLSARVGERSRETRVDIRKAGGPVVRTLKLGRVDQGRVAANWNGRRSNGDIVPKGKYTFQFIGTDVHGIVGKSNDKVVYVSPKQLVKKSTSKTISAAASFRGNGSGACSDLFHLDYDRARFDWPKGVGYYSNVYCKGRGSDDAAIGGHSIGLHRATRYGQATIQAYGAGAFKHAGPGAMLSLRANDDIGAKAKLGTSLGWYGVRGLDLEKYAKSGRLRWLVGTVNGNWYDVKEFRISYTYFVLQ